MLVFSLQYGRASYICWVMIYGICEMRKGKLFKQMQCWPEKHRSDGLYHRQNESLWIRLESLPQILQPNAISSPDFALWVTKGKPQSGKILSGRKLQRKKTGRIQTSPVKKMTSMADKIFYPLLDKNKQQLQYDPKLTLMLSVTVVLMGVLRFTPGSAILFH